MGAFGAAAIAPAKADGAPALSSTGGDPIWLQLAGIVGQSIDGAHAQWIDLSSFAWASATRPPTAPVEAARRRASQSLRR